MKKLMFLMVVILVLASPTFAADTTAANYKTVIYESNSNGIDRATAYNIGDSIAFYTKSDTEEFTEFHYNPSRSWLGVKVRIRKVNAVDPIISAMNKQYAEINAYYSTDFDTPSRVYRVE